MTEGTDPTATPGDAAETPQPLVIRGGRLVTGEGFIVGSVEGHTITLNLGWCREAGVSVRCTDDPAVDRHRDGFVLDRPAEAR